MTSEFRVQSSEFTRRGRPPCLLALMVCFLLASASLTGLPAAGRIASTADSEIYPCDGATVDFDFDWPIFDDNEIRVVLRRVADGHEIPLSIDDGDYTVTMPNDDGFALPGGTVTLADAPNADYEVVFYRVPPLLQTANYKDQTRLSQSAIENSFDKVAMQLQYLYRLISRATLVPETDPNAWPTLPDVTQRANQLAAYDADGAPTTSPTTGVIDPILTALMGIDPDWLDVLLAPPPVYSVRALGATGNGTTDDSVAVTAAFAAAKASNGGTVFFPAGVYKVVDVNIPYVNLYRGGSINIQGASTYGTRLISTSGHYCLRYAGAGRGQCTITRIAFGGWDETQLYSGVLIDPATVSGYPTLEGMANIGFRDCEFIQLDTCVKNVGCYPVTFDLCTCERSNTGLEWTATSTEHGGCLSIRDCDFAICDVAGIALLGDPNAPMQQVLIQNCRIQGCAGFGLYAQYAGDTYPLVIDSLYEEINGSGSNVTIGGHTFANPSYNRFDRCQRVVWRNGVFPADSDVNDTQLETYNAFLISGKPNVTGDSILIHHDPLVDSGGYAVVNTYAENATYVVTKAARSVTYNGPLQGSYDFASTNMVTNGSCSTAFTPVDVNGAAYDFTHPGPIFDHCLKIRLTPYHDLDDRIRIWHNPGITSGKFYVFSLDVRSADANDGELSLLGPAINAQGLEVKACQWRRYWSLNEASATNGIDEYFVYLWNPGSTPASYYLADFQQVEFATAQEMREYVSQCHYAASSEVPRVSFDSDKDANLPGSLNIPAGHTLTIDGAPVSAGSGQFTDRIYSDGDWDNETDPLAWQGPTDVNVTLVRVVATLMGSSTPTLTYNIEIRGPDTLGTAGTNIFAASKTADADGDEQTSFAAAVVDKKHFLVLTTSSSAETGTVDVLIMTIYYTRNAE